MSIPFEQLAFSQQISMLLAQYGLFVVFFGALLFGETVILSAAFLSAQGFWSIHFVFLLAFIATLLSDSVWYLIGKRSHGHLQKFHARYGHRLPSWFSLQQFNPHPFYALLSLLFIKFFYGTRIIMLLYLGSKKIAFHYFTLLNAVGTFLWLVAILFIGWLAGRGYGIFVPEWQRLQYLFLVLILMVIVIKLLFAWLGKFFLKK